MKQTHILSLQEAQQIIPSLHKEVVVTGGCFDLLHPGHTAFLEASGKEGECLVILLESDKKITEIKGKGRPQITQETRAKNLAELHLADYIVLLPYLVGNSEYDQVISSLKPAIIATTLGDPYRFHKERQAKAVGARVVDVIKRLPNYSTTKLLQKV